MPPEPMRVFVGHAITRLKSSDPSQPFRARFRIVGYRHQDGVAVLVSREWQGWQTETLPTNLRPDDDLVVFVDPDVDRSVLGRFVNELRDFGHTVEIAWPVLGRQGLAPDA